MAEGKVSFDGWDLKVSGSFLNRKKTALTDRQLRVFLILDGHARDKPFCWLLNETIGGYAKKTPRQVQEILAELEAAEPPWIARVPDPENGHDRAGFVLFRRGCPASPAWPRDRPLEEAAAMIGEKRGRRGRPKMEAPPPADSGRGGEDSLTGGGEENGTGGVRIPSREGGEDSLTQKSTPALKSTPGKSTPFEPTATASVAVETTLSPTGAGGRTAPLENDLDPDTAATRARLAGLLVKVRDGSHRRRSGAVTAAARLLAEANLDGHSVAKYAKELWPVARGERDPDAVLRAFDATHSRVIDRGVGVLGSYFFGALGNIEADVAHAEVERDIREGKGADHGALPAAGPKVPPPAALQPSKLQRCASIEELTAALRWLSLARVQLPEQVLGEAASGFCRAFTLCPRGSMFDTAVPGVKWRCRKGFYLLCRYIAEGRFSWQAIEAAFEAAMGESRIDPNRYKSDDLGRAFLRLLCVPKTNKATAQP